jgi:hypothetical protein
VNLIIRPVNPRYYYKFTWEELFIGFCKLIASFRNITNSNDSETDDARSAVYCSHRDTVNLYQKFSIIQGTLRKYTGEPDATCLEIKWCLVWDFGHLLFQSELKYQHKKTLIEVACKLDPHTNVTKLIEGAKLISNLEVTKTDDHKQS